MGLTFNDGYGGGNGSYPTLEVTITNGSATSVTATLDSTVVNLTYDSAGGVWRGTLKSFGTWTVEASNGKKTASDTVDVTNVAVYTESFQFSPVPSGYTELEYIESTGTQYINTGINGTACYGFFIEFYPKLTANFGGILSGAANNATFAYYSTSATDTAAFLRHRGAEIFAAANVLTSGVFNTALLLNNAITINGVQKANVSTTNSWGTSSGSVYLSAYPNLDRPGQLKWKSLILYAQDQTTELRRFYPARRNSDSVLGMYDLVTNTFYTNAGSGSFVAGPEV